MKAGSNLLTSIFFSLFFIYTSLLNALSISITSVPFQNEESKYLEVYIQVIGNSVTFVPVDSSSMKAAVDFTFLLKKDGKIVNFDKFSLQSPISSYKKDFIGLRRFKIDTGAYTIEVNAIDVNDRKNNFKYQNSFNIDLNNQKICTSGIQLLADVKKSEDITNPFVKNGYYMEPALSYFLPQKVKSLGIYFEVYNLDKYHDKYSINLNLNKGYKGYQAGNIITNKIKTKKVRILPVLTNIDINALPSGNYHLEIDVVDSANDIVYSKFVNFQRSNPISEPIAKTKKGDYKNSFVKNIPKDSLYYSLRALLPVVTGANSIALNNVISAKKDNKARFFLWNYWINKNEKNPELQYKEYMKYAKAVDVTFRSQVGYGFETDRGIIYLRYGKPSQIISETSEPNAPPYEIWFYDIIEQGHQRNIKFIFYMPSLAHNDYQLLHSNCRGEKNDPGWIYKLYSKRTDANSQNNKQAQLAEYYQKLKNSYDNNAVRIWEELK